MSLLSMVNYIDAKKTIDTEEKARDCVDFILQEFEELTLEEILYVFQLIKKGKFGKLYERLTGMEILQFLREYSIEDRMDFIEHMNFNLKTKRDSVGEINEEFALKFYKKVLANVEEKNIPKKAKKRPIGANEAIK